jgi:hypothetical protein
MADKKISELTASGALTGTELVPVVQSSVTVKTTAQDIANLVNLSAKANINSPVFTGVPEAPTPTTGDNTTKVATTAFVQTTVGAAVNGLSWKQAVRAATTAAVTLATGLENGDIIDGVTLVTGDRILVKNQAAATENGIYIVAATGAPARSSDADAGSELVNASVYVSEGTTLADTQWTCSTNAPITIGSTNIAFAQLTSGGGGLTNFTDAVNTAAPNATVPVSSLTATNAATNVDAAIVPKGTGALLAAIPDNTTTGGNKRGSNAIDLNLSRSVSDQVAGGTESVAIGNRNKASATHAVGIGYGAISTGSQSVGIGDIPQATGSYSVSIGYGPRATGQGAVAIGGSLETAASIASGKGAVYIGGRGDGGSAGSSGNYSACIGGWNIRASGQSAGVFAGTSNNASGTDAAILGGSNNTASAQENVVVGGQSNTCGGSYRSGILSGYGNNISGGPENTIAGGNTNAISSSGDKNFIGGGGNNTISGTALGSAIFGTNNTINSAAHRSIIAGQSNTVSATYAGAFGYGHSVDATYTYAFGGSCYARGRKAFFLFGGGVGGYDDTNTAITNLVGTTTDGTTPVKLTSDGAAAAATNQLSMTSGSTQAMTFTVVVIGTNNAGTAVVGFEIKGVARGPTMAVVGTPVVTMLASDAALSTCAMDVVTDSGNSAISIRATGVAATTIRWNASVHAAYIR